MIRRCSGTDPNLVMYVDPATGLRDECEMMVGGAHIVEARPCRIAPTVGTNGVYRYCALHARRVRDAGGTIVVFEQKAVEKPCDCGLVFDDVKRSVIYPHEVI